MRIGEPHDHAQLAVDQSQAMWRELLAVKGKGGETAREKCSTEKTGEKVRAGITSMEHYKEKSRFSRQGRR